MHFSSIVSAGTTITLGIAQCMTDNNAEYVANNFRSLITNYTTTKALRVLREDYTEYSDSLNGMVNFGCTNGQLPLGAPSISDREQLMVGQSALPSVTFEILNIWHDCNTVIVRYKEQPPGNGQLQQFVTGIVVLETVFTDDSEPWVIHTVFLEFNSLAYMYDLGIVSPMCDGNNSEATTSLA